MDDRDNRIIKPDTDKTIYPYKVDITSIPERKYLFGIYYLSKYSYILLLLSIIISMIIILKAYNRNISPYFIYWDKYDNEFKRMESISTPAPKTKIRKMSESTYLMEYFIRDYLEKTFTLSLTPVKNEEIWCDCNRDEKLKNNDFLNITKPCYICNFSASNIYSSFIQNQKPYYEMLIKEGISQEIKIVNMTQLYNKTLTQKKRFIDNFLPQKEPEISSEYKVDFIIYNKKNNQITNEEVLTAYIKIGGLKNTPRNRKVVGLSYVFHPNYELILKEDKGEQ